MDLIIIAALSENFVIGKNGKIPWYIPEDLQRFRKLTLGNRVIMGRKTYESLPEKFRPLPRRENIVLTTNPYYSYSKVIVMHSIDGTLEYCRNGDKVKENFVIGGEKIFRAFFPYATKMELTHVHRQYEGDAFFPDINWNEWQEVMREDKRNKNCEYSFVSYVRRE
ncbi:dihydrofolate reductase [Candidatus Pacearchaeota archaeon]|nr:dihydrofolate reductase [Candidatus Pacearchaeota archaeon]